MCFSEAPPQGVILLGELGDQGGGNHSVAGDEPQRAGRGAGRVGTFMGGGDVPGPGGDPSLWGGSGGDHRQRAAGTVREPRRARVTPVRAAAGRAAWQARGA